MQHAARDHIRDRFEAPMRVIRETGDVIVRIITAEGIHHQKRVQPTLQWLRDHSGQLHTRAIRRFNALDQLFDATGTLDVFGRRGRDVTHV